MIQSKILAFWVGVALLWLCPWSTVTTTITTTTTIANAFVVPPNLPAWSPPCASTSLEAAKSKKGAKNNKKKAGGMGGGFGGSAMEPCPCGSSETYSRCCGKIHKDVNAFKSATASQIVRARYSAYSKKQPEFLMASTHPLHKDFNTDLKEWKEQIKVNMYDNFDLPRCFIVEENYYEEEGENGSTDEKAKVKFVAELVLRESGEVTAFMETAEFERAKTHGGWLYKNGTIETAPEELLVKNLET